MKRIAAAVCLAMVLAGVAVVSRPMNVNPCASLTPDDTFWWWFYGCGKDSAGGGGGGAG